MVTLPTATATGLVSSTLSDSPPSGFFPIGTTLVTVTAVDADGNKSLATFTVTVQPAATKLSLTDKGPSPSTYRQTVSFNLSLTSAVGTTIPDGETVSLEDAGNGNAVVARGTFERGTATLVVSNLDAGTHSLFAAYLGDATNGPSQSSAVSQVVAKRALMIEAVPNTKGYDGTTDAAALPVVVGLQGTDAVSGLGESYATAAIGTGIALTPVGTVADAGELWQQLHGHVRRQQRGRCDPKPVHDRHARGQVSRWCADRTCRRSWPASAAFSTATPPPS